MAAAVGLSKIQHKQQALFNYHYRDLPKASAPRTGVDISKLQKVIEDRLEHVILDLEETTSCFGLIKQHVVVVRHIHKLSKQTTELATFKTTHKWIAKIWNVFAKIFVCCVQG